MYIHSPEVSCRGHGCDPGELRSAMGLAVVRESVVCCCVINQQVAVATVNPQANRGESGVCVEFKGVVLLSLKRGIQIYFKSRPCTRAYQLADPSESDESSEIRF